jgi:Icc-related predicted phosphoesterase
MATVSKQDVRILILSDTHNLDYLPEKKLEELRKRCVLPVDVVIHCGDITDTGSIDELRKAFAALGAIDAELRLVIAGNHEWTLDRLCCVSNGGSQYYIDPQEAAAWADNYDVTLLSEGTHSFTLRSGANFTVYASPYTPTWFGSNSAAWGFQYRPGHDRFNPEETVHPMAKSTGTLQSIIQPGTDIVITHGPPKYIRDFSSYSRFAASDGCQYLRHAICRVKPKLHCFGHMHRAYGIQRVEWLERGSVELEEYMNNDGMRILPTLPEDPEARKKGYASMTHFDELDFKKSVNQTLFVNAAMKHEELPVNPPWSVCLEL